MDLGYDDVHLGYMINKLNLPVTTLHPRWNLMSMFTEPWSNICKADAFVIHYAGQGFNREIPRIEQIRQDILVLNKYRLI